MILIFISNTLQVSHPSLISNIEYKPRRRSNFVARSEYRNLIIKYTSDTSYCI